MFQVVYVSSAVLLFTDEQLRNLLEGSRRRNQAAGVTGLLLYLNGNFIQLLEGERETVLNTRDRIFADQRHRGMIMLLETECGERNFPDWSMGFEKLGGPDAPALPGYSDFLQRAADPAAQKSSALKLLEFFRELNAPARPR